MKTYTARMLGTFMAIVLTLGFMGLSNGQAAGAADPTPQQVVAYKVYYNVPLNATDAYVFYLMVKSVSDIADSVINKAITDYNNGDPSTLKVLPTSLDTSVDIASAGGGQTASAGIPVCGSPGYAWGFTMRVKSVTGATLFSDGYNIWWQSFCGAVIWMGPNASRPDPLINILHDTTNLGGITGWSWKDFNPDNRSFFSWNGQAHGAYHNEWWANWERCIPIPLVGTYCLGDYHVHEHVDVFADGVGCLQGTGQGTRKCWYGVYLGG